SHFVAITGWTHAMRHFPSMPPDARLPHYLGFGLVLWSSTLATTAFGFGLADLVPQSVTLGLVFLTPIYFMLTFVADSHQPGRALALGFGAVAGPLLHLLDPDWGLLATGLIAGTAAFLIAELHRARRKPPFDSGRPDG